MYPKTIIVHTLFCLLSSTFDPLIQGAEKRGSYEETRHLSVLNNADLGSAKNTAVELEALLLYKEDGVVLLFGLRSHESRLVFIGVELVANGIHALETVLGESGHEDGLGHLEALVEVDEVLGGFRLLSKLFGGDGGQGAVEVVDALNEVLCELLDGKVARSLDLALSAVLKVAEVGDGAEAFVLETQVNSIALENYGS